MKMNQTKRKIIWIFAVLPLIVGLNGANAFAIDCNSAVRDPSVPYDQFMDDLLSNCPPLTDDVFSSRTTLDNVDFGNVPTWDPEEITAYFRFTRDLRYMEGTDNPGFLRRISWLYPNDGCFSRAEQVNALVDDANMPKPYKLFAFGGLRVYTDNDPNGSVSWWYHVVSVVKTITGEPIVLDAAISPHRALEWTEWLRLMTDNITNYNNIPARWGVTVADPNAYHPFSLVVGEPSHEAESLDDQQTAYLNYEWNRQIELGRDPNVVLGDSPPWGNETIGNTEVFSRTTTTQRRRAAPYTMNEEGIIKSVSIYHEGGNGNDVMLLAVYSDNNGKPHQRIGQTPDVPINTWEGWQTIELYDPVQLAAGSKIWLAWSFENNPGIRYTSGTPGRADSGDSSFSMPYDFGSSSISSYIYSIHANYQPIGGAPGDSTIGNTEVFSRTTTTQRRRAAPYTMVDGGYIDSISIYHEGGYSSEYMLLAVYDDNNGRPYQRIGQTPDVQVNTWAGWQTIDLYSPVYVSPGSRIWLAWSFEDNPGIRYTSGSPGRADSGDSSFGMPYNFGSSSISNYIYSIYATYRH